MVALELKFDEKISEFAQACLLIDGGVSVEKAAKLMNQNQSGCIVITSAGSPVGILTEWDILSRVVAQGKDPKTTMVRDVMSSPLLKVEFDARVGDAIRLMINRGIRRLAVIRDSKLVGIVTQNQVIGSRRAGSAPLPILEPARGSRCPYCNSVFENRDALSNHIDKVHIGAELLRGVEGRLSTSA